MDDEAKLIKDFVNIEKSLGGEINTFVEILREIRTPNVEDIHEEDIAVIPSCISSVETEKGIKSCITLGLENIDRRARGRRGEIPIAREFYEKLKERAKSRLKLWGNFQL